jgi:UDP-glucose 4-epimerase
VILVTGGAGYIGSHFVYRATTCDTKEEIVVIDNLSEGHEQVINTLNSVHFINCNFGDSDALDDIFNKFPIEAVVHFAANAYVGESQSKPFKYFQNNVINSINLFEAMERHGVRKVIFSSSCATYGIPEYSPLDELHPQKPINTYGMTKLMVEQILERLAETLDWGYVALRYFNAAGAEPQAGIGESHSPEPHLVPRILQAIKGSLECIEVHGDDYDTRDGTCVRDYIHVSDLADGHIAALRWLRSQHGVKEAINLGTEHGATVMEVITKCAEIADKKPNIRIGPRRPGDPPHLVANSEKAKRVLGWQPAHSLDDIISSAWAWEKARTY